MESELILLLLLERMHYQYVTLGGVIFLELISLLATLNHFQNPGIFSQDDKLDITLPTDEVDQSMFTHDSDDSVPTPFSTCTYLVRTISEGVYHIAGLLCILVDISMAALASHDPIPAHHEYMAWMLDSFVAANEKKKELQADSSLKEACKEFDIACFSSLHILLSTSRISLKITILRKGYYVLSTLCADLLENFENLFEQPIQRNICSSLLNLAAVCKEHDSGHRAVSNQLLKVVQLILDDDCKKDSLSRDFEVFLSTTDPKL